MFDAIEFRGKAQATVEELADGSDVPVYNGLTDEWHPTQMLADFLTMSEHAGGRPLDQVAYCFLGDGRFNMGRSLLVMGAIMGSDVRICAPKDLWPDKDVQDAAQERAEASGARITLTDDPDEGLRGADFVHTDVWVSMGEPKDVWAAAGEGPHAYQVNAAAMARTGNPGAKFMHCLPAFHDTTDGRRCRGRRAHRDDRWARGHRRGLRVAREHRVRPGREPAAHDQGADGRHPRLSAAVS